MEGIKRDIEKIKKGKLYRKLYDISEFREFFQELAKITSEIKNKNKWALKKEYEKLAPDIYFLKEKMKECYTLCNDAGVELEPSYVSAHYVDKTINIYDRAFEIIAGFCRNDLRIVTYNNFYFLEEDEEKLHRYISENENSNAVIPGEFLIEEKYRIAKQNLDKYVSLELEYQKLELKREKYPKIFFTKKNRDKLTLIGNKVDEVGSDLDKSIKTIEQYKIFREFNFRQLSVISSVIKEIKRANQLLFATEEQLRWLNIYRGDEFRYDDFKEAISIYFMNSGLDDTKLEKFFSKFYRIYNDNDNESVFQYYPNNQELNNLHFSKFEEQVIDCFCLYVKNYFSTLNDNKQKRLQPKLRT